MNEKESQPSPTPRVPLGGDYWTADPGVPLWGFADLHAHLMAHVAFGGNAFWGLPYDPDHPGPQQMQHALPNCHRVSSGPRRRRDKVQVLFLPPFGGLLCLPLGVMAPAQHYRQGQRKRQKDPASRYVDVKLFLSFSHGLPPFM